MIALAVALTVSTASLRAVFPPSKAYSVSVPQQWELSHDWNGIEPSFTASDPEGRGAVSVGWFSISTSGYYSSASTDTVHVSGRVAKRELFNGRTRVILPERDGIYILELEEPPEGDLNAREAFRILLTTFKLKSPPRKPVRPQ